jgi:transposase
MRSSYAVIYFLALTDMDLVLANKARQQQLMQFQEMRDPAYQHLKIAYEEQTQKLFEQKQELIEYKAKANYWEGQFKQIQEREQVLSKELFELQAQLKKREQQLFGRKSEKNKNQTECNPITQSDDTAIVKPRGQQKNSQGHGRRDYSHLPSVEETHELPKEERACPCCGLLYEELATTEDSTIVELINVKAYTRLIRRKKYKRNCQCTGIPQMLDAPAAPRPFPKGKLGVSIWAYLLLQKYHYQQPINRVLKQLEAQHLCLAPGTVTDGFQQLLPLLLPVYEAIVANNLTADHWHADETGWRVFEEVEGKKNHRWFMWVFQSKESIVYKICPTRSSNVIQEHFGVEHAGGLLSVDRYGAYKAIARSQSFLLAFCWAHVRRDFLSYAKGYPNQEVWALGWVDAIATLYHINNQRIKFKKKSKMFREHHQQLINVINKMRAKLDEQLNDTSLLPSAKKLLKSLTNHWDGLTIFVDAPEIPMDNNIAERSLRHGVLGRNNYYGSGAVWSSVLAAVMFTLFRTMALWNLNVHTWLLAYLHECSCHQSSASPEIINKFLPWNMNDEQKLLYIKSPKYEEPEFIS